MPTGSRLALLTLLALLVVGPVAAQPATGSGIAGSTASPAAGQVADDQVASQPTNPALLAAGPDDGDLGDRPSARGWPLVQERPQFAFAGQGFSHRNTSMLVQLTPEGDADWRIVARFNLTNQAQRESFRDLGTAFQRGDVATVWLPAFREASEQASTTSGRDMRLRDVERSWEIQERAGGNPTGVLRLSFTWTNFARVEQDQERLVVSDAFRTTSGSWLSLVEDQTLVVEPPEDFTPVTGTGDLQEQSFYWEGPRSFDGEVPSAVFAGGAGSLSMLMVASLVVASVLVVVLLVYLLATRRDRIAGGAENDDGTAGAKAGDATGAGADGGAAAAGAGAAGPETAGEDDIDVELLSDEERVERLLERNGGRMKQASIVKETGWSNAKVSQLLSSMEEADQINKLRIGRENLISFPDEDVADIED